MAKKKDFSANIADMFFGAPMIDDEEEEVVERKKPAKKEKPEKTNKEETEGVGEGEEEKPKEKKMSKKTSSKKKESAPKKKKEPGERRYIINPNLVADPRLVEAKTEKFQIMITPSTKDFLDAYATEKKISRNEVINQAIYQWMMEKEKEGVLLNKEAASAPENTEETKEE